MNKVDEGDGQRYLLIMNYNKVVYNKCSIKYTIISNDKGVKY